MNNRIAFYASPYPRVNSWYTMIDEAAKAGMTHIEGFTKDELAEPDPEAAKKLRAYADEKGIRFCCLSCYCNFSLDNTEAQLQRMKNFVDAAAILGSPYFHHTVVAGYATPDEVLKNWDTLFDNAVSAVRKLYDYAEARGVRLIYEDQGYMINGVKNYGKFLEAVDRNVGVLLDMGNNYNVDEELDGFLETYLPRICHVHIKDVAYSQQLEPDWICTLNYHSFQCLAMGEGIIDHQKYVTRLEEAGYTGFYALEYGAPTDDSPLMERTIEQLEGWLRK